MKLKLIKTKKALALILSLVIAFSMLISASTSYAKTRDIFVDVTVSDTTDGAGDLLMYKFEPKQSGMYSLLSMSPYNTEAYLFIKEENPDGSKKYTQLAYSNKSPDFEERGQTNINSFCLTYHLEQGKIYYYGVGVNSEDVDSAQLDTLLVVDAYDDNLIDHIEAKCDAPLTWYTDGEWKTDAKGEKYYYYNISKIISNTLITVYYTDGTVKKAMGVSEFDGITINYRHNQINNHWYNKDDENYLSNDLTIEMLNKKVVINVEIQTGSLLAFKGKVVDYLSGDPVEGARLYINGQNTATTDKNGNLAFTSAKGAFEASVQHPNGVNYDFRLMISGDVNQNDHTLTPYKLVMSDYVNDDVINAKDASFVYNSQMTEGEKTTQLDRIDKTLGFNSTMYQ